MIDPYNITDFNRSDKDLQRFWLFCVLVAGKNSDWAAVCLRRFLHNTKEYPLDYIKWLHLTGSLHQRLVEARTGQYGRVGRAFIESVGLDLRTCSLEALESIYGVGPKSVRFFLLHSRPGSVYAVLDRHVLKWMRDHGVQAPRDTPPRNTYPKYEAQAIKLIKQQFPDVPIADADLHVWKTTRTTPH